MATQSEVKAGLDDIATVIRNARNKARQAKAAMTAIKNELNALPTTFSAVVAQIGEYTPAGAFQTLAKDELAKLTSEFQALRGAATAAETSLSSISEF